MRRGTSYRTGADLRAEQLRSATEALPFALGMSLVVATVLAVILSPVVAQATILTWFLVFLLVSGLRLLIALRSRQAVFSRPDQIQRWMRATRVGVWGSALVWAAASYLLFAPESYAHQGALALVIAGVTAGAVASLAPWRDSSLAFALLPAAPLVYRFAESGHPLASTLSLLVLLFMLFMVVLALRVHRTVTQLLTERTERRLVQSRERRRNHLLEQVAKGAGTNEVLEAIVLGLEAEDPRIQGSILILDETGKHLITGAAPSLPKAYNEAIDGLSVGPGVGSCGACAHTRERVVVDDVRTHPFWIPYREAAANAGLVAAWSEPVFSASGELLGTFAIYHREPHHPTADELAMVEQAAHLAGIAIERCRSEKALRLAALVYENSSEAMMITDEQNRIIATNPAFTRVTGYTTEEVLHRNPSVLNSGRQDAEFYRALWLELEQTGRWQGEIWNRRKNGEEFAEWLTINTIVDAHGRVNRHVALFSDITEKKRMDALIWTQANYDPLTNLPNRRLFLDRLEQGIRLALRGQTALALLFIDLDHFKEVNDTLGHQRGDELLAEAARRIRICVRDSDTVARLGGDEFTVILGELEDLGSVAGIAQKILTALDQPYQLGKEQAFVSGSVGIAIYPHDASDATGLLKKADHAMLAAKQQGRNRFSYFTDEMLEAAQARMRLMSDLQRGLAANEFVVVYQPVVELATGRIDKAEALVRWNRPGEGWLGPAEFLPVAEEAGLIRPIGDWVFQEATTQAKRWRATVRPRLQISVNRSQAQFLAEGPDDDDWVDWLAKINLPGDAIAIEIAENLLFRASEVMNDKLVRLRDAGVHLAIDGFGTGFSSLADLKRFDIHYLKIARSLVGRLDTDESVRAVSEAIVVMAHKLGLTVIAEGVETEVQREILVRIGCDYGQGNALASPLSEQEFEALLRGQGTEKAVEGSVSTASS